MCGRYTLYHTRAEIEDFFHVPIPAQYAPRYNIAPTQPVLIVREAPHSDDGRLEAEHVVWGLIPPWAEDPRIGSKMINARCETAAEKASYKHALRRRRCIVPVSGFYEWKTNQGGSGVPPLNPKLSQGGSGVPPLNPKSPHTDDDLFQSDTSLQPQPSPAPPSHPRKQPYLIRNTSGEPLALAGLWETWHGPNGELIESCTILTTSAIPRLRDLHDRMPVIIPPDLIPVWLDRRNEDIATLAHHFVISADCDLTIQPVSTAVNSVRNDGPELIRANEAS